MPLSPLVLSTAAIALLAGASAPPASISIAASTFAAVEPQAIVADTAALFDGLGEWVNSPVDASALDNGVALVIPIGDDGPVSRAEAGTIVALAGGFVGRPVQVFGLHADNGWRIFQNRARVLGVTASVAHDAGDAFRGAMHAATGVDRPAAWVLGPGAQVRAVEGEVFAAAAAVTAALEGVEVEPEAPDARDSISGSSPTPTTELEPAGFESPGGWSPPIAPSAMYDAAGWPEHNTDPSGKDYQGRGLPYSMSVASWQTQRPDDLDQRVIIIDFPEDTRPYNEQNGLMNRVRAEYAGQVEVLGLGGHKGDEARHRVLMRRMGSDRPALFDPSGALHGALEPSWGGFALVLSTDGTIRWQGDPTEDGFEETLEAIVQADPVLQALRGDLELSDADREAAAAEWREGVDAMSMPRTSSEIHANNRVGQTISDPFNGLDWLNVRRAPRGDAPIVVSFWAAWCPPCRAATPMLEGIQEHYGEDIRVVAYSGQSESRSDSLRYVRQKRRPVAHGYDADQALYKYFNVKAIPHTVVLDRDGTVVWQGNPHSRELRRAVEYVVQQDRAARFDARN